MAETVLITGGTGSLGHALTERFLEKDYNVVIHSRDEKKQYDMRKKYSQCEYVLGDVRDYNSLRDAVRGVDTIVHGASLKYVNIGELQPIEYISTNVNGTMNLINAVLDEKTVKRCVGISTDKACMPVNTYGLTKALLEKVFLEAVTRRGDKIDTKFNVARYGNVVGTRGSVIPFWQERIEQGLSLPITNPDMTRFFFTLEDAVDLIEYTLEAPEGIIVSKKMKACTLEQLAKAVGPDSEIEIVGERPGEKHHEMLLSEAEMLRTVEQDGYFVYTPGDEPHDKCPYLFYGSMNAERLTIDEIKGLI